MNEKITIEVTKEMIDAVEAHKRAENKRATEEYNRRWREYYDRVERETKEKVLAILPDITDAQYGALQDIFRHYEDEMRG